MFGTLGGPELLLILVIALIVFGPRKLPEIGKSIGKMMVEFRRASNDFKRTLEDEVEADKLRSAIEPPHVDLSPSPATKLENATPPDSVPYGESDGYSEAASQETGRHKEPTPETATAPDTAPYSGSDTPSEEPAPESGKAAVDEPGESTPARPVPSEGAAVAETK